MSNVATKAKKPNLSVKSVLNWILDHAMIIVIVLLALYVQTQRDAFLKPASLINIISLTAARLPMALGVAGCIILAGTDLTGGRVAGLTAFVAAILLQRADVANRVLAGGAPANIVLVLLLVMLIGACVGLINGFVMAKFKVHPYIITLAMQMIVYGIYLTVSNSVQVGSFDSSYTTSFVTKPLFQIQTGVRPNGTAIFTVVPMYVLLALISARIGGEWTVDTAMPTLELLFEQQYKLTTSVEKETRYRTEWKKEYKQVEDPKTGEMKWRENWVQIEVAYTYTICKVKLVNKILSHLPFIVLSREKIGMYALYMATLGNYPDLFAGKPHASQLKEPMEYEVPEAYKQADPKFAKLIEVGERYIGYPYVWGGDSPETSFDCSGFISWIFKESGVRDVGRLGATSLYGVCTPIEPEEARPGDLIFFQGTLGDGVAGNDGITHVALYVGDGYILNCGNPISYADLSRAYWQEHFYGFGRMYE